MLGEGLPPVPPKLVAKIKQGDFVQMHKLYYPIIGGLWRMNMIQSLKGGSLWAGNASWISEFGSNVLHTSYTGVVAASQPE